MEMQAGFIQKAHAFQQINLCEREITVSYNANIQTNIQSFFISGFMFSLMKLSFSTYENTYQLGLQEMKAWQFLQERWSVVREMLDPHEVV